MGSTRFIILLIVTIALFSIPFTSAGCVTSDATNAKDCTLSGAGFVYCGAAPGGVCYRSNPVGSGTCACCFGGGGEACDTTTSHCTNTHCCPTGDVWNGTKCTAPSEFPTALVGIIGVVVAVLGAVFIPKVVSKAKSRKSNKK